MASITLLLFWLQCLLVAATPGFEKHDKTFVPDEILRVSSRNISVACETRQSAVVNGTAPGPELRILPGQTTWIRVYNDMTNDNLTMHWHGLAQRMAIFSDGSPQASQWPIPPGHFFDYELQANLNDSGTYFYHSHIGTQALSCSGALIIDDCGEPPYKYDDERTLHWSDYFNVTDKVLEDGLEAVPFVFGGETQGVLLNGKGIALGHEASENSSSCSLPIIDIDPGKTYRFRFIGSTGLSLLSMAFEDHDDLNIIQVDGGQWTKPVSVDRIQLGSGQRFDALFKAKTEEELKKDGRDSYFLQFETRDRPEIYTGYAILRYSRKSATPPSPKTPPLTITNTTYNWLEYQLQPLHPESGGHPTLDEVTRRVVIDAVQLTNPSTQQVIWRLANLSWTEETLSEPRLVNIYKNGDSAVPDYNSAVNNHGWDPKTRAFAAKTSEVLEIVFQNTGSIVDDGGGLDVHPFHAHGEHFYDIGSGNGTYDAEKNEKKMVDMGYKAVRRDTTMLYRYAESTDAGADGGWRAWRIRVEQPGVWMIHCHTLQHMIMGMQTLWVVGDAEQIRSVPLEYSQGYLDYGGDAYGNDTHDPTCIHQWERDMKQCKL